jgi:predicted transcriptional regulator
MNIQKIISELLSSGLTQQELASLVPCSQSLISALLRGERGSRLSFQVGQGLMDIHRKRCAQEVVGA